MTKQVRVNDGCSGVRLPDGNTYSGPVDVTLTDDQFASIPLGAFFNEILTDLTGHVATVPSAPGGGGGVLLPIDAPTAVFSQTADQTLAADNGQFQQQYGPDFANLWTRSSNNDWLGVTPPQLAMDFKTGASNYIPYPFEDAAYDIQFYFSAQATNVADHGKVMPMMLAGASNKDTCLSQIDRNGQIIWAGTMSDCVYAGLGPTASSISFYIYGIQQDVMTLHDCYFTVVKR
jgi:hypothetical protein